MKTSVQNTLGSWMPQSVTDRLIQVLSRKADEICGFITDQWHTQMAKAYNAQKKKLAEQRELKFYEYKYVAVAPPQIGAEKTNRNLFHKMVHWFDQKFWNGAIGVVNGQYTGIMNNYKKEFKDYAAKKINAIIG